MQSKEYIKSHSTPLPEVAVQQNKSTAQNTKKNITEKRRWEKIKSTNKTKKKDICNDDNAKIVAARLDGLAGIIHHTVFMHDAHFRKVKKKKWIHIGKKEKNEYQRRFFLFLFLFFLYLVFFCVYIYKRSKTKKKGLMQEILFNGKKMPLLIFLVVTEKQNRGPNNASLRPNFLRGPFCPGMLRRAKIFFHR